MIYKSLSYFLHGQNDGLFGYNYINPKWNTEDLKDYTNGLIIGKIQLSIKNSEFQNCTYENFYNQFLIHVWLNSSYKALSILIENKKDLKQFKELTGIQKILKQN